MKFDKKKFAEQLEQAKGNRSINEYARECGISAAHISRLLRQMIDTAPSPDTIEKLVSKAHNGITYYQLMQSAGYLTPNETTISKIKRLESIIDNPDISSVPSSYQLCQTTPKTAFINALQATQIKGLRCLHARKKRLLCLLE